MTRSLLGLALGALVWAAGSASAADVLPLDQVKPGMKGVGRTVFEGTQPVDFDVEIIGVLENIGPRQSMILARLHGGPLEKTGVIAGMSGSPVYVDGKLMNRVNLHSDARLTSQKVYSLAGLKSGQHTIRIVKVSGDALRNDTIRYTIAK